MSKAEEIGVGMTEFLTVASTLVLLLPFCFSLLRAQTASDLRRAQPKQ